MEPSATNPDILGTVTKEWPGAFGVYKYSKQAILTNWRPLLAVLLLTLLASIIVRGAGGTDPHKGMYLLAQLISLIVAAYASVATTFIELKSVKRENTSLNEAFAKAGHYFLPMLGAVLLMYVLLTASIMLLVVPFFFVLPRLVLMPYFLVDNNLGPLQALKASWNDTRGYSAKVWGIIGVTCLFALISITIIGIPFTLYFIFMYSGAQPLLYRYIRAHTPASETAIDTPAPAAPSTEA